nr:uncharacterized protein LOC127300412 [Lolium perenne]
MEEPTVLIPLEMQQQQQFGAIQPQYIFQATRPCPSSRPSSRGPRLPQSLHRRPCRPWSSTRHHCRRRLSRHQCPGRSRHWRQRLIPAGVPWVRQHGFRNSCSTGQGQQQGKSICKIIQEVSEKTICLFLGSHVKVSANFVSQENLQECRLAEEFRPLPKCHREDKYKLELGVGHDASGFEV